MSTKKLSPHTIWLFAFGSIAAGIGASYALQGFGTKVTAGVYFALVAIGGFGATYLTSARTRGAVLAFFLGAAVAAIGTYVLVNSMFSTATSVMTDVASAGQAHAQGVEAGAKMGNLFGIYAGVIVFLETIVAGIGGAVAGAKTRDKLGVAALGAMSRAAR